ncbi:MAG TPA: hypothetical protein VK524_01650 [Polyangiaceae bacterium]|nr:hypothetical protein [Polyangiaceae bacterium]
MATRVQSAGPGTGVVTTDTAVRVTPSPTRPFKEVMRAGARAVIEGADAAVRKLPGGPILAAAVRPGQSGPVGYGAAATRAEGPTGTAAESTAGSPGIEGTLSQNADMNLYYLELQERISAESRAYSALSNVLKARHDTVKNAIGNLR